MNRDTPKTIPAALDHDASKTQEPGPHVHWKIVGTYCMVGAMSHIRSIMIKARRLLKFREYVIG